MKNEGRSDNIIFLLQWASEYYSILLLLLLNLLLLLVLLLCWCLLLLAASVYDQPTTNHQIRQQHLKNEYRKPKNNKSEW